MSFVLDISKFTDKAVANSEKVFRGSSISLFSNIIKRTPVKTGRLRGNWQTDINQPSVGTLDRNSSTPAISEAVSKVNKATLDDSIFLVNNLPYANAIENGSSAQAPEGMVAVSIAEFQREVDKQARQLK
tara:strand:- start:3410 stop:3799 length:390 start_codon:yes stop_codon:yes gene_type:complete